MGRRTTQGWPVHGSTMDLIVADGRGSLELGLTAVLVRGGLPRGWQGEGGNIARPGEPLTGAWTVARRWCTDDGTSASSGYGVGTNEEGRRQGERVRCSTGAWVPFYRVGRGRCRGWSE
jgi:hypothetical protein